MHNIEVCALVRLQYMYLSSGLFCVFIHVPNMRNFNPYFKFIHQKSILLKITDDIGITKINCKITFAGEIMMKNNFKLIAVYVFAICLNILYNYMEPVFVFF